MVEKFFKNTNVEFFVNKEKGVVVAKFIDMPQAVNTILHRLCDQYRVSCLDENLNYYDIYNKISGIRGIAKCAPEDTFDEKTGKKLAITRLKFKTARAINSIMLAYREERVKDIHAIDKAIISNFEYERNLLNKIEDILDI